MPGSGSLILIPIEAHFTDENDDRDHISTYCDLHLGAKHAKTEICKHGGSNPFWRHPLVVPVTDEYAKCTIEVMGEEHLTDVKETAGICDINLEEIKKEGNLRKWYTLTKDGRNEGDILIEASFLPELPPFFGTRSTPSSSKEMGKLQATKSCSVVERKAIRKFSDNREDRLGRGWNMYVPGEDDEPKLESMDDTTLKKCKSAMPSTEGEFDGRVQRRRSFWEKIFDF
jgi:hypothetical protein